MAQAKAKEQVFQWEGKNKDGNVVKGRQSGPSEAIVKAKLRQQGITPTTVKKQAAPKAARGKAITPLDIAIFSRQLATMMKAGVPLVQSFEITSRGHENPSMRQLLETIQADIEGGASLTESLARHPKYFDDLYVNLVESGEKSGALETMLDKIAIYKEKTEALRKKIKKALTYPSIVVLVAIIVTGILLYFVVPQFESLFQGFGADLPAFTRMVIDMSEWLQAYWWIVIGSVVIFSVVVGYINRTSATFRWYRDKVMLKLPVVGMIIHKATVARFARTLSTMFAAGVPLVEALESVAKASGNLIYQDAILTMRDEVATGQQLQKAMEDTGMFPNMAVQMIAIGEESGSLDSMSEKVADFYEGEVDDLVDNLSTMLEPLIMAILGILVGGLVVAMYLPIFQMGAVV